MEWEKTGNFNNTGNILVPKLLVGFHVYNAYLVYLFTYPQKLSV